MDRQQVITFLERLAQGIDATTGAPISIEALRGADAVLALKTASSFLAADSARRGNFVAAGTPWSGDEDAELAQEFDSGRTVAQIALQHGRTSHAIRLRLVKLGRLAPETVKGRERTTWVA